MAGTYSKYDGQPYQSVSSKLILIDSSTQSYSFSNNYVYTNLLDNESKLIDPIMLRDSILSIWDTNAFKETSLTGSNSTFIGVDSGDDSDRDLKSKIYLGNRFYEGNEIMSSTLLNSEVDIFLYNTKLDSSNTQNETRLVFLSGTNSSIYSKSNYISSEYVVGLTQSSLDFNFVNKSGGDINILSRGIDHSGSDTDSGGVVSINNIEFPSYQISSQDNLNSKVLSWLDGGLTWSFIEISNIDYAGITGSELNIYGSPINLNNYSLEFTDNRRVPIDIGDITRGKTFSNDSISDVLNQIVYNYLSPTCELELNTGEFLEVGTSPNITISYVINKKINNLLPTILKNMIPGNYPSVNSNFSQRITGQSDGIIITPLLNTTSTFTITVNDGITKHSASKSVTGIYPYFYGFIDSDIITSNSLTNLTKIISPNGDINIDISGVGNFYFIYDSDYGLLSNIYDNLGNSIIGSFSHNTGVLSSPDGYWQSKEFNIYKCNFINQIGPPTEIYQFVY